MNRTPTFYFLNGFGANWAPGNPLGVNPALRDDPHRVLAEACEFAARVRRLCRGPINTCLVQPNGCVRGEPYGLAAWDGAPERLKQALATGRYRFDQVYMGCAAHPSRTMARGDVSARPLAGADQLVNTPIMLRAQALTFAHYCGVRSVVVDAATEPYNREAYRAFVVANPSFDSHGELWPLVKDAGGAEKLDVFWSGLCPWHAAESTMIRLGALDWRAPAGTALHVDGWERYERGRAADWVKRGFIVGCDRWAGATPEEVAETLNANFSGDAAQG